MVARSNISDSWIFCTGHYLFIFFLLQARSPLIVNRRGVKTQISPNFAPNHNTKRPDSAFRLKTMSPDVLATLFNRRFIHTSHKSHTCLRKASSLRNMNGLRVEDRIQHFPSVTIQLYRHQIWWRANNKTTENTRQIAEWWIVALTTGWKVR